MEELDKIYMGDDAISGADVYKPVTDWATDKLNQPFEPLFNVKPTGFTLDNEDRPGVKSWRFLFPENKPLSADEAVCRSMAPRVKERDANGGLTMNPRAWSNKQGLFGATDAPCIKETGQEKFSRDFTNTMSNAADWINKSGAAAEDSINPLENRNWQQMPSMQAGKGFKAQPLKRDYGVPREQEFSIEKNYKAGLAKDLSEHLLDPVYGQAGQDASAELKNRYVSTYSDVNGKDLWNRLKNDFGVEQASQIINRLSYFSGVRGNPTFSGNEIIRFSPNEAERAMEKMEQENRNSFSPENPAYNAHGFDFGNQPDSRERELSLRPSYDDDGYDYEPGPDPREYGVPKNTRFSTWKEYRPELAEDISRIVSDPVYGENGQRLAKDMRQYVVGTDNPVSGRGMYHRLASEFGQDRAHEIIKRLDYFSGIDGFVRPEDEKREGRELDFETWPGEGYPALFR